MAGFGTCEQLGPDMNLAGAGAYQFSAKDEVLTFVYAYSASRASLATIAPTFPWFKIADTAYGARRADGEPGVQLQRGEGHAERGDGHGAHLQRHLENQVSDGVARSFRAHPLSLTRFILDAQLRV